MRQQCRCPSTKTWQTRTDLLGTQAAAVASALSTTENQSISLLDTGVLPHLPSSSYCCLTHLCVPSRHPAQGHEAGSGVGTRGKAKGQT